MSDTQTTDRRDAPAAHIHDATHRRDGGTPPFDQRIVAVLGRGVVPPDAPVIRADDAGVVNGDGIFETMHVRAGRVWLLDEHLDRLEISATQLDLALPDRADLVALIAQALAPWPVANEGALRLICTRGPESGPMTIYATVAPVAPASVRARRDGVTVRTASLGYPAAARQHAPWLLAGAKTLSYAINAASRRWAIKQGADDLLWTSTDGFALECPSATLVWRNGDSLLTVPADVTGVLRGTTACWLLDHAADLGYRAGERMVTPAELVDADGAWFASAVRGITEIRAIDGQPLRPAADTSRIRDLLGFTV